MDITVVRFHEIGGPDVLKVEMLPQPVPGPGEVRVGNTHIGVNMKDVQERTGDYPIPGLPHTPGLEAVGIVEAVGSDVTLAAVGDRVCYRHNDAGCYATARIVAEADLIPMPEGLGNDVVAASLLKGMTARFLLKDSFPVGPGTTVLAHAAAGGVGQLLCQWAKHLGATVIGTVGSAAKVPVAQAAGCDHVIDYNTEDFQARVMEITGGAGVDVVYDSVGKATFDGSMNSLTPTGTFVMYGVASGMIDAFNPFFHDNFTARHFHRGSLYTFTRTREMLLACANDFFEVVKSGAVKVNIHSRFPLEQAADAHRLIESRATTGSVILIP